MSSSDTVLLLDSNVWSHLVLGASDKQASVQRSLQALLLKYPGAALATSAVCVAECLVAARRLPDLTQRLAAETGFDQAFAQPHLLRVPVTDEVLDLAATLRADALRRVAVPKQPVPGADGGKLKLPDAIIAASCLQFSPAAVLVTENDADFRYLGSEGQSLTVAELIVERVA